MPTFSDLLTTTAALVAGRSVVLHLRRGDRKKPEIDLANREKLDWMMGIGS